MTLSPRSIVPRAAVAALLVAVLAGAGPAAAAPAKVAAVARAEVLTPAWVSLSGDVSVGVRVRLATDVSRLEVRLRLYDAEDRLVWQRTQSRGSLSDQTYVFSFARPVRDLALTPGVYTARAQVRADRSADPTEATATLLLADPAAPAVPVSVIVRVAGVPARDPEGLFVFDPLDDGGTHTEAASLAQLALLRPELRLSAAIAPVILDDWSDASDGYTAIGAEETVTVSADGTGAVACRATLDSLGRASGSGLTLLRGMYAEPDAEGLVLLGSDAPGDVADQLALGARVASDTLRGAASVRSVEPTGLAVLGGALPASVASSVVRAGVGFIVVDPSTLSLGGGRTASPGVYTLQDPSGATTPGLTALALDRTTARMLLDPTGGGALRARLLERSLAKGGTGSPVVLELTVGEDGARIADIQSALVALSGLPWVRLVDAPAAAAMKGASASLLPGAPASTAPDGYWDAVARARLQARALAGATAAGDGDAVRCRRDAMLAGSRCWAGPDGTWTLADRGLEYARAAETVASATLSAVRLDVPGVTLSGSSGRVPVSIQNGSGKVLSVVVTARSAGIRLPKAQLVTELDPGENILSLPVDLGQSLSAPLSVTVTAGGVRIVESTTTVRASYLDRVVVLAGVVLVLLMLLLYIRRKARPALAGRRERADDSEREAARKPERRER